MINRITDLEQAKECASAPLAAIRDMQEQVIEQWNDLDLRKVVKDHPVAVLAAGAAVGLLLGWWVKRR